MGDLFYDFVFEGIYVYFFVNVKVDDFVNNIVLVGQVLSGVIELLELFLLKNGLVSSFVYVVFVGIGVNFCIFNGDDLVILLIVVDGFFNLGNVWVQCIDVVGNGSNWGIDVFYYCEFSIIMLGISFDLVEWISVSIIVVSEVVFVEIVYLGIYFFVLLVQLLYFEGSYVNGRVVLEFVIV